MTASLGEAPSGDELLARILNDESPVGPASADELDRGIAKALYDTKTEINKTMRATSPVFLIGRRGSGKTAVLKGTFPEGQLDVTLDAAVLLRDVGMTLDILGLPISSSYTDLTTPVWRAVFVAALCAKVHSHYCRLSKAECPEAFNFGRLPYISESGPGTDAASRFLGRIRESASLLDGAHVARFLDSIEINGTPLWIARQELERAARAAHCQAVVSIDSLDRYETFLYSGGFQVSRDAQALQALFRTASQTGRAADSIYKVRVSFPAELWHYYSDLSSNPLKDFDNSIILHWSGSELLELVARRFLNYLRLHHPNEYRKIPGNLQRPSARAGWAQELFNRYLPGTVTNALGGRESIIAYILRHTQLLPRHMIHVVNAVLRNREFREGVSIRSGEVQIAVNDAADLISNTVLDAYSLPYPELKEVCEAVIPTLPLRFSAGELHTQMNRTPWGKDFLEVLRMLVEVGVVGRVVEEGELYLKADFEYLHHSRMYMVEDDELCLHPVFASRFDCQATKQPEKESNRKPIYPYGSDLELDVARTGVHVRDAD